MAEDRRHPDDTRTAFTAELRPAPPAPPGMAKPTKGRRPRLARATPTAGAVRPPASPEDEGGPRLGLLEDFIGLYLRLAYERAFADFAGLLGEDAQPPGHFTMLTLIANNPGITQVEIGRAAGRDKSSVTKALRQMEEAGLVRRVRLGDDRRACASHLTAHGAEVYARLDKQARRHLANLVAAIGEKEAPAFLATLKRMIARLPSEEAQRRLGAGADPSHRSKG